MFHVKPNNQSEELIQLARQIGVDLTNTDAAVLLAHWELVSAANAQQNLTAIRDYRAALRLHIVDSLTLLPLIEKLGITEGVFVDIGSGAGYPGIPLAVTTGLQAVLLEPRLKRAEFLRNTREALCLDNVEVIVARAEEAAVGDLRDSASIVVARAVSSLPVLVELAAPLLSAHGILVASKGRIDATEERGGLAAADIVGMKHIDTARIVLPGGGEHRTLVAFEKTGSPSIELPRAVGKAQKRPLG